MNRSGRKPGTRNRFDAYRNWAGPGEAIDITPQERAHINMMAQGSAALLAAMRRAGR